MYFWIQLFGWKQRHLFAIYGEVYKGTFFFLKDTVSVTNILVLRIAISIEIM